MRFRTSLFVDAFLGSGVPLAGDPLTAFKIVPLLALRTGTIVENRTPVLRDVVKVRFIATNCGESRLEIIRSIEDGQERDHAYSENDSIALLPGESSELCTFRSWDAPGIHQLSVAYAVRCAGLPFARLAYPAVAIRVRAPEPNKLMHWLGWARPASQQAR